MKTRLLIAGGMILFLIGISVLAYEIFGDSDLKFSSDTEVSIIFYVIVPGFDDLVLVSSFNLQNLTFIL